jgi:prepilin-type N-terminal cleavage/methylation domain-containing protein
MMKKSGFTLIELLMASVVLVVIAAIAIPNFTRAQRRAKEAEVKSVAHVLQAAVEDYKTSPTWTGMKPTTAGELAGVLMCYMPGGVPKNPFNPSGTFIRGGPPQGVGEIGYQYSSQTLPYTISCMGGTYGDFILTLVEGQ